MKCIICGKKPKNEAYYNIGEMTVTVCEKHIDELLGFSSVGYNYSKPGKLIQRNL